jgi:hypothetical protein
MGTRSLTFVYETYKQKNGKEKHTPIIKLYRQYDGYMEGHGLELAEFLAPYHIVNGLGGDTKIKVANGMGCLAAQLVASFKDGPGQFYLYPPKLGVDNWQEYEYHVYKDKVVVTTIGSNNDNTIFEGTWGEFLAKCKKMAKVDQVA